MSETKNYEQFRGLLRGAICNRTQAQFARESGISPEHLSRMLNNPKINRPSQATLGKIAAAAKNGVTLQDLLDALDAGDGTNHHPSPMRQAQAVEDFEPDFHEMAETSMQMLLQVLAEKNWPAVASSPEEYADDLISTASEKIKNDGAAIAYDCGICRDYIGGKLQNVEKYMPVYLSMAGRSEAAESILIIYYNQMPCADGQTRAVIQCATCAAEYLEDLYGTSQSSLDRAEAILAGDIPWPDWMGCQESDFKIEDGNGQPADGPDDQELRAMAVAHAMPYDIKYSPMARFVEKYHGKGSSAEERVLTSIFGEEYRWSETLSGFGFWLDDDNPPEQLAAFLSNQIHKRHVLDSYDPDGSNDEQGRYGDLEQLLGSDHDNMAIAQSLDEFEYQDPDILDDAGWGSAVATAMRAETGFAFAYHKAAKDQAEFPGLSEKSCVLITDQDAHGISREALIMATCRYAKALGIKKFGDILFTGVHEEFRKPMTYTVKEHREGDEPEQNGADEAGWVAFDPEDSNTRPAEIGGYTVELKDGRVLELFWIPKPGVWIRAHKEWSHMIARYIPKAHKPEATPDEP